MSNLVIVAIPDESERVWKVSSEKIPHMTLLYLGETGKVANLEQIMLFVEHAASMLRRFYLTVDHRGELGEDQADVLFFKKNRYDFKAIRDFRATLLQDNNIRIAYDSATQFDGVWNPHLTLGYPEDPAKKNDDAFGDSFYSVDFTKIAVWDGDYEGPEFLLKDHWDEVDAIDSIPMDVAMSDIQHHGTKGMKWGVRKEHATAGAKAVGKGAASAAGKINRAAGAISRGIKDAQFEEHIKTGDARDDVEIAASHAFRKQDLPSVKARHGDYGKLRNRAKKPFSKEATAYRKDARETYIKRLESTANATKNASGTRQYTIRERGIELPAQGGRLPTSKYQWDVTSRVVKHAAGGTFTVELVMDSEGYITDLKEVKKTMAQTMALGEDFLEHYGIRGMKWGVRKHREVSAQSHADTGVLRRQTKITVKGGVSHPASNDAVRAAIHKQKLKKSGTAALSNQELQELSKRLQLELQVKTLTGKKGQAFVKKTLEDQGKEEVKGVVKKGTRKVAKTAFALAV